jgi:hypothetical protein
MEHPDIVANLPVSRSDQVRVMVGPSFEARPVDSPEGGGDDEDIRIVQLRSNVLDRAAASAVLLDHDIDTELSEARQE